MFSFHIKAKVLIFNWKNSLLCIRKTKNMPRSTCFFTCISIAFLFISFTLSAQVIRPEPYAGLITAKDLEKHVLFFSDTTLRGRETGSPGATLATQYLVNKFKEYGLLPFGTANPVLKSGSYIQSFICPTGQKGRNVIGILPGSDKFGRDYLIVSAHYDHLGVIEGRIYPGADSNASGVSVLLNLARAMGQMYKDGKGPSCHIIFIAYDAKEFSMTGARIFTLSSSVPFDRIVANVNIDQIGSVLEPPGEREDYVLVLGADQVPERLIKSLNNCNAFYNINLQIDYTFYNSPSFAGIFFSMTEQSFLASQGVPSLLITSGVSDLTYKPSDTPGTLNFPVMQRRARWLFYSLWDMAGY